MQRVAPHKVIDHQDAIGVTQQVDRGATPVQQPINGQYDCQIARVLIQGDCLHVLPQLTRQCDSSLCFAVIHSTVRRAA